jgi:hypothetical protein
MFEKYFRQCKGWAMQFLVEVWCRSENIQLLDDFSNLFREKLPIQRKRVIDPHHTQQ